MLRAINRELSVMPKPMLDLTYLPDNPNTGGWKDRHILAVRVGLLPNPYNPAYCLTAAIDAWVKYAAAHYRRHESEIGDDSTLGPAWEKWGVALLALLDGEIAPLDGGTLSAIIHTNLETQGFKQ